MTTWLGLALVQDYIGFSNLLKTETECNSSCKLPSGNNSE